MNPAAKLQQVMELYNNGFLCKCHNWIDDMNVDFEGNEEDRFVLFHESNCEGKEKVLKLLEFKNEQFPY